MITWIKNHLASPVETLPLEADYRKQIRKLAATNVSKRRHSAEKLKILMHSYLYQEGYDLLLCDIVKTILEGLNDEDIEVVTQLLGALCVITQNSTSRHTITAIGRSVSTYTKLLNQAPLRGYVVEILKYISAHDSDSRAIVFKTATPLLVSCLTPLLVSYLSNNEDFYVLESILDLLQSCYSTEHADSIRVTGGIPALLRLLNKFYATNIRLRALDILHQLVQHRNDKSLSSDALLQAGGVTELMRVLTDDKLRMQAITLLDILASLRNPKIYGAILSCNGIKILEDILKNNNGFEIAANILLKMVSHHGDTRSAIIQLVPPMNFVMLLNHNSNAAKNAGAEIIRCLVIQRPRYSDTIRENGCVAALLLIMQCNDPILATKAAQTLTTLCSDNILVCNDVRQKNGLHIIVNSLKTSNAILKDCAVSLLSVVARTDIKTSLMLSNHVDGMQSMIKLLDDICKNIVGHAVSILFKVVNTNAAASSHIKLNGGITSLIRLLSDDSQIVDIKCQIVAILSACVARDNSTCCDMHKAGGISVLMHMINDKNKRVSAAVLKSMTVPNTAAALCNPTYESGWIAQLIPLLADDNPEQTFCAVTILCTITAQYPTYCSMFRTAGGLAPLSRLLSDKLGQVRSKSIQTIYTLISHDKVACDVLRDVGAIPPIIKLLDDGECDIRSHACRVLIKLSSSNVGNCDYIRREGLLPPLIKIALDGDSVTRVAAVATLRNITDSNLDNCNAVRKLCHAEPFIKMLRSVDAGNYHSTVVLVLHKVMFERDVLGVASGVYSALQGTDLSSFGIPIHGDDTNWCLQVDYAFVVNLSNNITIPLLVQKLSDTSEKGIIQCAAAEIICAIVVQTPSTHQAVSNAGAVTSFLAMLGSAHVHVQKCSIMVICFISCALDIQDVIELFCGKDFVVTLAGALKEDNDEDMLEFVLHFFLNYVSHSSTIISVLSDASVMSRSIRICESSDDVATLLALRLLHEVCSGSRTNQSLLCELGGVQVLVCLLTHPIASIRLAVLNIMLMITDICVRKESGNLLREEHRRFPYNSSCDLLRDIGINALEDMLFDEVEAIRATALKVLLHIAMSYHTFQHPLPRLRHLITKFGIVLSDSNSSTIKVASANLLHLLRCRYNDIDYLVDILVDMLDSECCSARKASLQLLRCMAKQNEMPVYNAIGAVRIKTLLNDINAFVKLQMLGLILDFCVHRSILSELCDSGVLTMIMTMVGSSVIEIKQIATNIIRRVSGCIGACGAESGVEVVLNILRRGGEATQSYAIKALHELVQGEDNCMSICEAGGVVAR